MEKNKIIKLKINSKTIIQYWILRRHRYLAWKLNIFLLFKLYFYKIICALESDGARRDLISNKADWFGLNNAPEDYCIGDFFCFHFNSTASKTPTNKRKNGKNRKLKRIKIVRNFFSLSFLLWYFWTQYHYRF